MTLPTTMRAMVTMGHGDIDQMVLHEDWPGSFWYVPGPQLEQEELPSFAAIVPIGQSEQVLSCPLIFPAEQGSQFLVLES